MGKESEHYFASTTEPIFTLISLDVD